MFSFHKPKIYRSLQGCCICRAKSSSSRFTDSKRYELDFSKCFKITDRRSGEICNACVLLVKRWKKLPTGSNRNWHHVVDARAGPGTKSIMKMKSNKNKDLDKLKMLKKHKHKKKIRMNRPPQSPGGLSDDILLGDDCHSDGSSRRSSSPLLSDISDDEAQAAPPPPKHPHGSSKRKRRPSKNVHISSYVDLSYWKKSEICCGIIFKGLNGEVLVDTSLLRPCLACKPRSTLDKSPACLQSTLKNGSSSLTSLTSGPEFSGASNIAFPDHAAIAANLGAPMDLSAKSSSYADPVADQRNILEMES